MLPCDEKVSLAFSNLIANAIRYASSRITLTCRRASSQLSLPVDDGPGMAAEDLPHIFDRFYKGKGATHRLSIVKAVIEQHQGSIAVQLTEKQPSPSLTS